MEVKQTEFITPVVVILIVFIGEFLLNLIDAITRPEITSSELGLKV